MASRYPPDNLPIVDPGHVPHFVIDGIESYVVRGDWAFVRFFAVTPLVQHRSDFSPFCPMVRRLSLSLACPIEAQLRIRAQVLGITAAAIRRAVDSGAAPKA